MQSANHISGIGEHNEFYIGTNTGNKYVRKIYIGTNTGNKYVRKMKQRAEITFETEETVVLREGSRVTHGFCPGCGRDVLRATPQAVAFVSQTSEREIFRLIEQDVLHFTEDGCVLVCLESVKAVGRCVDAPTEMNEER